MFYILKKIADSNIWIAIASVALYQASLLQFGLGLQFNFTSLFIFSSSLFAYNLLQILGSKSTIKNIRFADKIIILISAIVSFYSFLFLDFSSSLLFIFAALLTFFYGIPLNSKSNYDFSLRNIWFLKSIIVAVVWTITCSIIPLLEFDASSSQIYLFSIEKFLFILGITIPYDIKDLQKDKNQLGMTSFAMKFGVSKTILCSIIILFLALCLAFYNYPNYRITIVLSYFLAFLVIQKTNESKSKYWFTILIDGLIIWYFLLCFLYFSFFQ